MATRNLKELPQFDDKLSYVYFENAVIEQKDKAIVCHQAEGSTAVPAAAVAMILLGPGTKVSHAAIKALADNNCLAVWVGQHGVRFYAQGLGGSRHSRNLIRQARLVSNETTRLQVVIRMYLMRFDDEVDGSITIQQLRGKEGIRVRRAYEEASKEFGVPWHGRSYKRQEWGFADPVNRALSCANACLHGLVHAAIISAGYSPALGFIHTGKQLSFVYDVADLYKTDLTVPLAFRIVAEGATEIERSVRLACRDIFHQTRLVKRILPDIHEILKVPGRPDAPDEYADDAAKPAELWDPTTLQTDMPLGELLKLDELAENLPPKESPDGRIDRGETDRVPSR